MKVRFIFGVILLWLCGLATVAAQAVRTVTLKTQPQAMVWADEVLRGTTDEKGILKFPLKNGRHVLRVRAAGYRETTRLLPAVPRAPIAMRLAITKDPAELVFQQAETARTQAADDAARAKAVALYRRAVELRPRYAEAHLGLARLLADAGQLDDALAEIEAARAARRNYAEASAVEGRIYRSLSDDEAAIASFTRALREARNYQPEAHTGLGLLYEEKGQYEDAAASFEAAIAQLYDTESALYHLIGAVYEKLERNADAVTAYQKYLDLAPNGKLAPAIRSTIEQLKRELP